MISVIVPIYNVENYIKKCIESICNQTYQDLEILLIDDGSTDLSGKICDIYAQKDTRIIVVHKNHGGVSDARNTGIEKANGEYLAFVDGDDYIHERMYEILMKNLQNTGADISVCGFKKIAKSIESDTLISKEDFEIYEGSDIIYRLWLDNVRTVVLWNKLYRKQIFNNLRYPIGRYHEDTFIIHRVLAKCKKIVYSNLELYYYVQRSDSIMSVLNYKRIDDMIAAYEDRILFFDEMDNVEALKETKKMILNEIMYIADKQIRNHNWEIVDYINKIYRKYYLKYHNFVHGKKYFYLFVHYKLYQRYNKI